MDHLCWNNPKVQDRFLWCRANPSLRVQVGAESWAVLVFKVYIVVGDDDASLCIECAYLYLFVGLFFESVENEPDTEIINIIDDLRVVCRACCQAMVAFGKACLVG